MSYQLLIKNAKISSSKENDTVVTNILVKDEKVAGYLADASGIEADEVIDAKERLVIPGGIDSHTHFMYQGFPHRENFLTGTAAAATGGLTTIIDMPCCSVPSARSVEQFNLKKEVCQPQAVIDFAFWGGVTGEDVREGWMHNVQEQVDAGAVAFKVYMTPSVPTYPRVTDPEFLECCKEVAKTGLSIGVHAENFAMCDYYVNKLREEGRTDGPAWAEARMELAEKVAIEMGISFSEETGVRYHVVHMSTGIGARLIRGGKKRGLKVTSEVCPHYLLINAQDAMTEYGACAKIAPPLRTTRDNEEMWEGLQNGAIDFVATDHAPYELESEKTKEGTNIWTAFPGIPGVETMLPIILSEGYLKGRLTLGRFIDVISSNCAKHYGLYPKKGSIEIGSDADFTIIDENGSFKIEKETMVSMCGYTPLEGIELKGKVNMTIVRGHVVYNDAEEGVLPEMTDEELQKVIHNYPEGVAEKYADIFKEFPNLYSAEYDRSYRKEHPEVIDKHIRGIKGIMVKPGFGEFVPRQRIEELERWLKFDKYERQEF